MVDEGDTAPAFTGKTVLPDGSIEDRSLDDFTKDGPAVLVFFPAAFSSVCTEELCQFRSWYDELHRLGEEASIVAISADLPYAQRAFSDQNDLSFPLVSDSNRSIIDDYGVAIEMAGIPGIANRAVFVVDADAKVTYTEILDQPDELPDVKAAADALRSLAVG